MLYVEGKRSEIPAFNKKKFTWLLVVLFLVNATALLAASMLI